MTIPAGPIGLGTALFARIAGARVTLVDRDRERLDQAAAASGAASGIYADEHVMAAVSSVARGNGLTRSSMRPADRASVEQSFAYVAHGGCYVLVGVLKADITFADAEFHKREMTLMASRNATAEDFSRVMSAIKAGEVPLDRIITQRISISDVASGLPRWSRDKRGLIKALDEIN